MHTDQDMTNRVAQYLVCTGDLGYHIFPAICDQEITTLLYLLTFKNFRLPYRNHSLENQRKEKPRWLVTMTKEGCNQVSGKLHSLGLPKNLVQTNYCPLVIQRLPEIVGRKSWEVTRRMQDRSIKENEKNRRLIPIWSYHSSGLTYQLTISRVVHQIRRSICWRLDIYVCY